MKHPVRLEQSLELPNSYIGVRDCVNNCLCLPFASKFWSELYMWFLVLFFFCVVNLHCTELATKLPTLFQIWFTEVEIMGALENCY